MQEEPAIALGDQEGMVRERNVIGTVCHYGRQDWREFESSEIRIKKKHRFYVENKKSLIENNPVKGLVVGVRLSDLTSDLTIKGDNIGCKVCKNTLL